MKIFVILSSILTLMGCENSLRSHIQTQKSRTVSTLKSLGQHKPVKPVEGRFGNLFALYESLRVALVADQFDLVPEVSRKMEGESTSLSEGAKDENKQFLAGIAHWSLLIRSLEPRENVRLAFGEISRGMVGIYRNIHGSGLKRYRCPMAQRYSDWLQPEESAIANPYMGQRMVACGFSVESGDEDVIEGRVEIPKG